MIKYLRDIPINKRKGLREKLQRIDELKTQQIDILEKNLIHHLKKDKELIKSFFRNEQPIERVLNHFDMTKKHLKALLKLKI